MHDDDEENMTHQVTPGRLKMGQDKTIIIITINGVRGACAAALLLRKFPRARTMITSGTGIGARLGHVAAQQAKPDIIYVCGIGIEQGFASLMEGAGSLKESGTEIHWFFAGSYMQGYVEELASYCSTHFRGGTTVAHVVAAFLGVENDKHCQFLLRLAEQDRNSDKKIPAKDLEWHRYIDYANNRYFNFNDQESSSEAIVDLALTKNFSIPELVRHKLLSHGSQESDVWFLGNSATSRQIRQNITKVCPNDFPVLILGPSGVGKELVARIIHEGSGRRGRIRPLNCSVLSASDSLANSELFGHTKGAYTGAGEYRAGAFETAEGGTLFLDEIGELSLSMQTLFLRVLDDMKVYPLGAKESINVDVRIIAATNRDLNAMVRAGTFRTDLFHRLNVLSIRVPGLAERPLKERKLDLMPIYKKIGHRVRSYGIELKLSSDDWQAVENYDWPGNIRQFENLLTRAALMHVSFAEVIHDTIREESGRVPGHGSYEGQTGTAETSSRKRPEACQTERDQALLLFRPEAREQVKDLSTITADYANHVFKLFGQNYTRTAQVLKISPNTLRSKLRKKSN